MLTIISEKQNKRDRHPIYYRTLVDDAGNEIRKERFDCRIVVVRKDRDKKICLMDAMGNLREEPTIYVNGSSYSGFSAKLQVAGAIQLLYTFCDLYGYNPKELTIGQVKEMMNFMSGTTVHPEPGETRTLRKASTVNQKYGIIKTYIIAKEWRTHAFSNYKSIKVKTNSGTDIEREEVKRIDANRLKENPLKKLMAPKHITPEQMKMIAKKMRENNDFVSLALSRLQYSYGLRRGEALGITTEDIYLETDNFGTTTYHITLRNRVSDAPYQSCKGKYHPSSTDEYGSSTCRDSVWKINISKEMYDQLQTLIMQTREYVQQSPIRQRNYEKDSKADSVICYGRDNRYVFIGKNGRRLSGQTWNNTLKGYYLELGISIDEGVKNSNCSHRLRHASSTTCSIYYTPLEKDENELRAKFLEELDTLIPEFNADEKE